MTKIGNEVEHAKMKELVVAKSPSPLEEQLFSQLQPIVEENELFLEKVRFTKSGRYSTLEVTVDLPDGPGQVESEKLLNVTRDINVWLDEKDPISSQYTLEVTTPGIERPLENPRHFRRAQGYRVQIVDLEKVEITGKLAKVGQDCVELDTETGLQTIALSEIKKARMVVEF